jgi:hypothetical protein
MAGTRARTLRQHSPARQSTSIELEERQNLLATMDPHESKDRDPDMSTSWEESKEVGIMIESKRCDSTTSSLSDHERQIEKRLLHKIDFLIMPLVILVYILNFLDRSNFAAAKLQGLPEDLHLTGNQYQIALSILYVGYVSSDDTRRLRNHAEL